MNIRKLLLIVLSFFAWSLVLSCKKKKNSMASNYKLGSVDVSNSGAIQHYRIYYDGFNNVDSMTVVGGGTDTGHNGYRRYNYFGSSYSVTDENGSTTTVQASTTGIILSIITTDTLSMVYSGTELGETNEKRPTSVYPFYTKIETDYVWQNGDPVSISSPTGVDSCTYNTSKSGQIGDAWRIDEFLNYGRPYITNTHLPTELTSPGSWIEKYFYQFDSQGRISQLIRVKNNNGVAADDSTFYAYVYYAY